MSRSIDAAAREPISSRPDAERWEVYTVLAYREIFRTAPHRRVLAHKPPIPPGRRKSPRNVRPSEPPPRMWG
ncbi:hypothetical protein ACIBG0_09170 [Nocardia sp. NPDC050630]|uniref:hypothetical protein n=1 Tax=Nocardia sp. NPDC050630 TaxID=3364321 RepID=UPI0037A7CB2C